MADNESLLDFDELNSSTISAFVKLQAFVRGFLVRKVLCDIRQEYEDIVNEIDNDSEVIWPDIIGIPSVKKYAKQQKLSACPARNSHRMDGQQNQTDVSQKFNSQSNQNGQRSQDVAVGGIPSHVRAESGNFFRKDECKNTVICVEEMRTRETSDLSPSLFPQSDTSSSNDKSMQSEQTDVNIPMVESNLFSFAPDSRVYDQRSVVEQNKVDSHRNSEFPSGNCNRDDDRNVKVFSVPNQETQIDLSSKDKVDGWSDTEMSNVEGVCKQFQVDESNIPVESEVVDNNSCDRGGSRLIVRIGESFSSVPADVRTEKDEGISAYKHDAANDFGISSDGDRETYSNDCGLGDEGVTVDAVCNLKSTMKNSTQDSEASTEIYLKPSCQSNAGDVMVSVNSVPEDKQVIIPDSDAFSSDVKVHVQDNSPIVLPDDNSGVEGVHATASTCDLEALPNDKESLLDLKKTLTMELLWIQQAINSRKHYLHLRQQLAS